MNFTFIANEFRNARAKTLESAVAIHAAVAEGTKNFAALCNEDPTKRLEIEEPISSTYRSTIHMGITNQMVHKHLSKYPHQVIEIFHAQLVQHWFDFLANVYRAMVMDTLKRDYDWKLPSAGIKISFGDFGVKPMDFNIAQSCVREFSFKSAKEKQKIVFKALCPGLNESKRLEEVKASISVIEQNIEIRNILQHHHGKIRVENLGRTGCKHFQIAISDTEKIEVKAGDQVFRTFRDLEFFSEAISEVLQELKKLAVIASLSGKSQ